MVIANAILTQTKHERKAEPTLTIRYYIAPRREDDKVYLADGRGYFFSDWLRATESAAQTLTSIFEKKSADVTREQFGNGVRARAWLNLCGVNTLEKFDRLVAETLPLLRLPPDSPQMALRCMRCNSKIWGREAVLTGLGSECRRKAGR